MSPDIISVKDLLKQEKIWNCAKHHMEKYHTSQVLTQFLLFRGFFHIFRIWLQNVETRVFSPSVYTVGEQRPKIQEGIQDGAQGAVMGRKRKSSDAGSSNGGSKTKRGSKR